MHAPENPSTEPARETDSDDAREQSWRRFLPSSFVWYATALLFLVSWIIAPGSVDSTSIDAMLPFAGILAIAAVGQTLVVMQRGIDLSLAGMMTLSALVVSKFASEHNNNIVLAIVVVAAMAIVVGLVSGLVISFFNVTPLVATLAMNAILVGVALAYSGGTPVRAPEKVSSFALDKTLGISNTDILAVLLVIVVALVSRAPSRGRRFVAVGASERASRTAGLPVERFKVTAYVAAALCYSAAGVLLAGVRQHPERRLGRSVPDAGDRGGRRRRHGLHRRPRQHRRNRSRRPVPEPAHPAGALAGCAHGDPARDPGRRHRDRRGGPGRRSRPADGARAVVAARAGRARLRKRSGAVTEDVTAPRAQTATRPPSTTEAVPATNEDSSLSRNSAAFTTSSTAPNRRSG